jgi:hypothetical protein
VFNPRVRARHEARKRAEDRERLEDEEADTHTSQLEL